MNEYIKYFLLFICIISTCVTNANEESTNFQNEIELMMDAGQTGTIYKATITALKVWMSFDGDHVMFFTLTDGTKWHTAKESDFKTALRSNWTIGDPVTIKGGDVGNSWEAFNHARNNTINLYAE